MLETKLSSGVAYPRSSVAARMPRAGARSTRSAAAALTDEKWAFRAAETPAVPRPVAAPPAQLDRLARSEARLLAMAVACTVSVCALLVIFLAEYAHVTYLGIKQANDRTTLRALQSENALLTSECAHLQSPDRIASGAVYLGMTKNFTHIAYVRPVQQNHDEMVALAR